MNRRDFVKTMAAASAAATVPFSLSAATRSKKIVVFSKHLQWLDYQKSAEVVAQAGLDGVDLTVRPGGHVLPERAEEDLPKAVEAMHNAGLDVPMMTTRITSAADPQTEKLLKVASELGIKYYRMGYLSYDDDLGIEGTLKHYRSQMEELADVNRQYGVHGAYQNHAGTRVGAPIWDLWLLLKGLDPKHIGIQYDIKHATAEGGRSWVLGLELVQDFVRCIVLKDFVWQKRNGEWRDTSVPLGTGMVDFDEYFKRLKHMNFSGPISLHLEYPLPHETMKNASEAEKIDETIKVLKRDTGAARQLMEKAGLI